MVTLLITAIFSAFVALGIPDSVFGSAWPVIQQQFGLPISYANFVTITMSVFTVIASLMSDKLVKWLGTGVVTTASVFLTAVGMLGFSLSNQFYWLVICSLPLGIGAGAIDTVLNNYVAVRFSSAVMSFLHCSYGIGVSLSPFIMSFVLNDGQGWRNGYFIGSMILFAISLFTLFVMPLWKKTPPKENMKSVIVTEKPTIRNALKIPEVWMTLAIFFGSVSLEFVCGVWGSSFLVNARNMPPEQASLIITFYYLGITLGRFISGLVSKKLSEWKIIMIGQSVVLVALVIIAIPIHPIVSAAALLLIGVGNGPLFPNLTHLTPKNFGVNMSQTIIGISQAACYVGIIFVPALFGLLADYVTIELFPYYMMIFFVITVVFAILTQKKMKKRLALSEQTASQNKEVQSSVEQSSKSQSNEEK